MYETIVVSAPATGVAMITLNRPEAANALNTRMGEELLAAWGAVNAQADLRAVILAGAGRHFAAGADLKERDGMSDGAWEAQHRIFEAMIRAQLACPVPVVGAVQGAAMGGGCEMALACDIVYADETARFGLPEAGLGIMPGLGASQLLPRAVGPKLALEIMTARRIVTATEALAWGLVNGVTAPEELAAKALAVAEDVARNAPLSVRSLKTVMRRGVELPLADGMALEIEHYDRLFVTADRREGVTAFNEKRSARFEGR